MTLVTAQKEIATNPGVSVPAVNTPPVQDTTNRTGYLRGPAATHPPPVVHPIRHPIGLRVVHPIRHPIGLRVVHPIRLRVVHPDADVRLVLRSPRT